MASFKTNKINRNFILKVHLYFNKNSYNRQSDSTPRFYLKPVQLLGLEKVAFTRDGAVSNGFDKYGNRFWKYKGDNTLTNAQADAIYEEIKQSYPYGYVENDQASIKKYRYDVKENKAFQSFYRKYWDTHQDEAKNPEYYSDGTLIYPHPYIEFTVNEIVTYKHVSGTVAALSEASDLDVKYAVSGEYYETPINHSCHDEQIDVTLPVSAITLNNYFLIDNFSQFPIKTSMSGRYRFDLLSGSTWPTGSDGSHSGYRFRFSTGTNGSYNGYSDYTSGVSYVMSPERGEFDVKVITKTTHAGGGDDGHPYMHSGSTSGFALSGITGSSTGINVSGYGHDEGAEITLRRESTYVFYQTGSTNDGHTMYIATDPSGAQGLSGSHLYTSGVGSSSTALSFTVPHYAPDTLYYVCTNHGYMGGQINIIDAPTAPKTGSVPGESIILNNDQSAEKLLHYYSPDISGAGGLLYLKADCNGDFSTFSGYNS